MVRLMLVLAPVMCILSAIGLSKLLHTFCQDLPALSLPSFLASSSSPNETLRSSQNGNASLNVSSGGGGERKHSSKLSKQESGSFGVRRQVATCFVLVTSAMLVAYAFHCVWVTSEAYSSPSIVLSARSQDGSRIIFDDFREAYFWLRMNTREDAKIMSWWDYGYQITSMANRTILVDNNTWNNTHISRVGQAMASTEEIAYPIMQELDVDYVLVIFGGLTGYSSDDINKFLWMVRIGGSTDTGKHIKVSRAKT